MQLKPYQAEGVKFLLERKRALLFDAPGLGKTPQALFAMAALGEPMATVCPASVVTQWGRSHSALKEEYSDTFTKPFHSLSYDRARINGVVLAPPATSILCLDESHFLKNRKSKRTMKILGDKTDGAGEMAKAGYVWCLTGTPMPKNPADLYPIARAVVPDALKGRTGKIMSYWDYINRFCVVRNNGFADVITGGKNLAELRERLAPHMLRRTRKDVMADWKEPLITTLTLDAGAAVKGLLREEQGEEGELILKALKAGGFDALQAYAGHVAKLRRFTGLCKVNPVRDWLMDEFDDNDGKKIVVIAYHREVIAGLALALAQEGIKTVVYWGGMSSAVKDAAVKTFQENKESIVFIGQLQASGTGLDGLHKVSNDILMMECSWIDDENKQAIGRLDRGVVQHYQTLVRFVALAGSLDESIMRAAERRAADNKELLD